MQLLLVAVLAGFSCSDSAFGQECGTLRLREPVTVAFSEGFNRLHVTFTPADDGTLHAADAADGRPLWTYRSKEATEATSAGSRVTDIRVLRFDAQRDGVIDVSAGDKVWLYFGVHSAGTAYYALDVTDPSVARLLWRIGADELQSAGQSWSTPTIARVRVGGELQNGEHFVLILGGGYDAHANTRGNRVFIVDAATGRKLWAAGGEGINTSGGASSGAAAGAGNSAIDLTLPAMRYPMPARVTAIDTDGDAYTDRLYAADLGGQVWRFDVWNGHARDSLVTGGVLASLGNADVSAAASADLPEGADARRFFNAPDVSLIQRAGDDPYYNIALGSGDAAAVEQASAAAERAPVHDRFYSLRDRKAFLALSQPAYDAATPIQDADLVDITDAPFDLSVPPDVAGWKLDLRATGTAAGERVLTESVTANGVVLFTTFHANGTACPDEGEGRVYAVKVDTAQPALDLNDDGQITVDDFSIPLSAPGVPASVRIDLSPPGAGSGPQGPPTSPPSVGDGDPTQRENTSCHVGAETLAHCVPFRALIRTFWRRHATS